MTKKSFSTLCAVILAGLLLAPSVWAQRGGKGSAADKPGKDAPPPQKTDQPKPFPRLQTDPEHAEEANKEFAAGLEKMEKKNYTGAAKAFEAAELYADDPSLKAKAIREQAYAWHNAGEINKEFKCLEKLLNGYPSQVDYAKAVEREFEIGNEFFAGKRERLISWLPWPCGADKSAEIYEKALKHGPFARQAPDTRLRLGRMYIDNDKPEEAIKTLRDTINMHPGNKVEKYARLELANLYVQLSKSGDGDGKYCNEARAALKEFLEKYPNAPEAGWAKTTLLETEDIASKRLYGIGRFYQRMDRPEPAARYMNEIVKEYPDSDKVTDAEKRLADIDPAKPPPNPTREVKPRYQIYKTGSLPAEAEPVMVVPENSNGKWLLPVKDLKLGSDPQKNIPPPILGAKED
jgi:outer membrane protein assembly factor BamD (BamD/ComL family)